MPVILPWDREAEWLDSAVKDPDQLSSSGNAAPKSIIDDMLRGLVELPTSRVQLA